MDKESAEVLTQAISDGIVDGVGRAMEMLSGVRLVSSGYRENAFGPESQYKSRNFEKAVACLISPNSKEEFVAKCGQIHDTVKALVHADLKKTMQEAEASFGNE